MWKETTLTEATLENRKRKHFYIKVEKEQGGLKASLTSAH
jgi:hypothetical protein